jgi:hypothetical protein
MKRFLMKHWQTEFNHMSKDHTPQSSWLHPRDARMAQYTQIHKCNTAYKQKQGQNHMILSVNAEKAFNKTQHPFMIKPQKKLGIEGMFHSTTKAICITNLEPY